jgi:hypothetical protein
MSNKHRTISQIATLAIAVAGVAFIGGETFAQKPFLTRLAKVYTLEKEKNSSCKLCHDYDKDKGESADKDNISAYGKLLKETPEMKPVIGKGDEHKFTPDELNAVEAAVKATGDKDTDGDGATNLEEIVLGTYPSNKDSVPAKDALEKYRAANKK